MRFKQTKRVVYFFAMGNFLKLSRYDKKGDKSRLVWTYLSILANISEIN
jgi:hypothetical protein